MEPIVINQTHDGREMCGPFEELLIRAIIRDEVRALVPVVVALHPGLFIDAVYIARDAVGASVMHGSFSLPTDIGLIRVVMSEAVPPRTGMLFGLKGSRPLTLRPLER